MAVASLVVIAVLPGHVVQHTSDNKANIKVPKENRKRKKTQEHALKADTFQAWLGHEHCSCCTHSGATAVGRKQALS